MPNAKIGRPTIAALGSMQESMRREEGKRLLEVAKQQRVYKQGRSSIPKIVR